MVGILMVNGRLTSSTIKVPSQLVTRIVLVSPKPPLPKPEAQTVLVQKSGLHRGTGAHAAHARHPRPGARQARGLAAHHGPGQAFRGGCGG